MTTAEAGDTIEASPCRACGACCAYSREWPRFTLESDEELDAIPSALVDERAARMRCIGARCAALTGEVGVITACAIYDVRPHVCRTCEPGDDACGMARLHYGLPALGPTTAADT